MLFSCQALVLAALALEGAVASPAHRHIHDHAHKRSLADLLKRASPQAPSLAERAAGAPTLTERDEYGTPAGGWNDPSIYTGVDFNDPSLYNGGEKKNVVKTSGTDTTDDSTTQGAAPPAAQPAPQQSSQPEKSTGSTKSTSSGGSGSCVDISAVWTKGDTSAGNGQTAADVGAGNGWTDGSTASSKTKRATAAQDGTMGNNGGSTYGRNMIPLSDCNDQSNQFTIKFTNSYSDGRDMAVTIWDKNGQNGQAQSGAFVNAFFMIDLPAGKSAAFAFEEESIIAFSELSDQCKRGGMANGIECIWGEASFAPPLTNGASESSWDVSLEYNLGAPGELTVSNGQPSGTSSRSSCGFTQAGQTSAGQFTSGGCNPNADRNDPLHLTATFGK